MKNFLLSALAIFILTAGLRAQEQLYSKVEYRVVAEGTDSPFDNLQIVCFNKYFNLEQVPSEFRAKYKLDDKQLYKKKMLIQLFYADREKQGFDKFEINEIKESPNEIIFDYSLINSDITNDDTVQSPFLIVQIPKNTKKRIRFFMDGEELGKGSDMYINN